MGCYSCCGLLNHDAVSLAKSSIWAPGGTGSRIFGDNIANNKAVKSSGTISNQKSAQEKLAEMQEKLKSQNLTNKQRKKFKKQEQKMKNDAKKRSQNNVNGYNSHEDSDLVIANVQTLTI